MQLAASVIVTVNVPAAKFERLDVVSPPFHKYETAPVAPVSDAVAVAVAPPEHKTLVPVAEAAKVQPGADIVSEHVAVQPFASVTVTVKTPAESPEIVEVVPPFDHKYDRAGVPPVAETVAVPSEPPAVVTSVFEQTGTIADGSETT